MSLLLGYFLFAAPAALLIWACCRVGAVADTRTYRDDADGQVCRDCGKSGDSAICPMCLEARR